MVLMGKLNLTILSVQTCGRPRYNGARTAIRHQAGFTLLETLATLTIFAIVMALLSSALFQVARLAELSEAQTTQSRDDIMRIFWLKTTLSASVTDWPDGMHRFEGGTRHVSGLTTRPLNSSTNSLTAALAGRVAFEWRLIYESGTGTTQLRYREAPINSPSFVSLRAGTGANKEDILIHAWPGNLGRFTYLQESGDFTDSWSPKLDPILGVPTLPVGVMLAFGETPQTAFAAIADRSPPVLRVKDI